VHSLPAAPVVLPRRLRSFGSCFYLCFGFHDLLQAQLYILEARHIFGLKLPSTVSCMVKNLISQCSVAGWSEIR
jgi:hypothetical protein